MASGRIIYKHEIKIGDTVKIELHQYANIIHVGLQNDKIHFWEEHWDRSAEPGGNRMEEWQFRIHPTGFPIPDGSGDHVGTVIHNQFVWHLYARRTK